MQPAIARAAIGAAGEGDDAVVSRKGGVGRRRHEARDNRADSVSEESTLDAGIKLSVLWTRDTSAVATMSPTVSTVLTVSDNVGNQRRNHRPPSVRNCQVAIARLRCLRCRQL